MRGLVHGVNGGLLSMVAIIMGVGTMVTDRMSVMNASLSSFVGGALALAIRELLKAYSNRVTMMALREIHLPRDKEELVDLSGARRPPAPATDGLPRPWLVATLQGLELPTGRVEKSSVVHSCIRVVGFGLLLMAFSFAIDWFDNRVGSY
ncbi:uncharacterized protein LOC116200521 [Punica granatum]|uniref:Uncharacterized protein LOC116200521 n=1 Tax=Punica granatum TaxID=22663 RepID=A0A6P8D7B9_PUNGR|nr:uncharacterized protein LOC116200521 [Punica granatum]